METIEINTIYVNDDEFVCFDYNPISNKALIICKNTEIVLPMSQMEFLCTKFLEQHSLRKDGYKEKYEELVKDYVRVTSNFVSLLANKK